MLIQEKKEGNIIWYSDSICKYRIKHEDLKAIIWVNYKGFDVGLAMMLWDFINYVDEAHIEMETDKSWENVGFKIDKKDIMYFLGVIGFFFVERNPQNMILETDFEHEWYSNT